MGIAAPETPEEQQRHDDVDYGWDAGVEWVVEDVLRKWKKPDHIRLHAGEMTAQEMRSVLAVLNAIEVELKSEDNVHDAKILSAVSGSTRDR